MEGADNSDGESNGTSSVSEDIPVDSIASPDQPGDPEVLESNETFAAGDERSQTPLQDEFDAANRHRDDEEVAEIAGSIQEVDISQTLHQTSQQDTDTDAAHADVSKSNTDEGLEQTIRDDNEELDYDEEVQADGGPVLTADGSSLSYQKGPEEGEKEDGEEEVDICFTNFSVVKVWGLGRFLILEQSLTISG